MTELEALRAEIDEERYARQELERELNDLGEWLADFAEVSAHRILQLKEAVTVLAEGVAYAPAHSSAEALAVLDPER